MSGRHLSFPFTIGADGRPETPASLAEHVKGEVIQLLLTDPGERLFQPIFGGGLKRLVFEANNEATAAVARARLTRVLSYYLAERLEVTFLDTAVNETTLSVDLAYRLKGSPEVRRLRFEHDIGGAG